MIVHYTDTHDRIPTYPSIHTETDTHTQAHIQMKGGWAPMYKNIRIYTLYYRLDIWNFFSK